MGISETDADWMQYALSLAEKAEAMGEVPVGAVLIKDKEILGEGWNQPITLHDPSAHAEVMAIRAAGKSLKNYRLPDSTLYVTLEPCAMCAGLMIHSRIKRVVFGAFDPKTGAAGSVFDTLMDERHNHAIDIRGGVLEAACSDQLRAFFKKRRAQKKG